ncbi:hypothetical protein GCM10011410_13380 [Hoyosella rhizosphaerae]|uniref:Uncharacterized protein n=1 Tax=Hoyosella rhizosphaerae TaxID=1755582 RepID=A0A916U6K7_9ACTN|nr:hypothetical protein GCM10011410_13380 [Hoyosella rhizosphaerae]
MDFGKWRFRVREEEFFEEFHEPPMVFCEQFVGVQIWVCPKIDVRPRFRTVRVNVDKQIFDRPRCQDCKFTCGIAELNILVKQHRVDDGPQETPGRVSKPDFIPNLLNTEALVTQRT